MLVSMLSALLATACPPGHPLRLDVKSFTTVEVVLTPTIDREVTLTLEDPKRPVRVLRWAPGPGVARQRVVHLPEGCWLVSPLVVDGEGDWKSEGASDGTLPAALTLAEPKLRIAFTQRTTPRPSLKALGTPLTRGARLKGGEPIGELLGIVTEIALEKASAAATRILRQTLARLCDEIMDDQGKPLLPATCDALRTLRLEDPGRRGPAVCWGRLARPRGTGQSEGAREGPGCRADD